MDLQTLRTFFGYCVTHRWLPANPAKELKAHRNVKSNDVVPYTLEDQSQILAACDHIGGGKYNRSGACYEQLRAGFAARDWVGCHQSHLTALANALDKTPAMLRTVLAESGRGAFVRL
jgi:hypothetical protein